jgi:tetratricopeptide (TPR) repeat protein
MGFLKLFAGKGPDEYERRGDRLFETGEYGAAKLEYETALDKAQKNSADAALEGRLREKIGKSREALALQHRENAERFRESGDYEGAAELLELALELTQDPEIAAGIEELLDRTRHAFPRDEMPLPLVGDDEEADGEWREDENEYFTALCGALDDEMQEAYHGYGDAFRTGYVALNRGDYELAVSMLSQALEDTPPDSMVPLELATAYLNLERYEEALALAEQFLLDHPGSVHGYHTLCETLWATERFNDAWERLSSCPEIIADTLPILHLKGESLSRSGRHQEAESLYREMLRSHGRDERTVISLAATCEALGRMDEALDLYGEIMQQSRGRGARINPFVKRKYADISLERGDCSAQILGLYLSLIEEDPAGRENHFRKVEQIYAAMGNEREARRYRSFADRLGGSPTE